MTPAVPVLIRNPGYDGEPRIMEAACHDGTPFLTCRCVCGEQMHVHESQIAPAWTLFEVEAACHGCREAMIFPAGYFPAAFQRMRDEGWIR